MGFLSSRVLKIFARTTGFPTENADNKVVLFSPASLLCRADKKVKTEKNVSGLKNLCVCFLSIRVLSHVRPSEQKTNAYYSAFLYCLRNY